MDFDAEYINPLWSLADPLTVQQAAALIAGYDPNRVQYREGLPAWFENETGLTENQGIGWVQTAFAALVNAIKGGKLRASLEYDAEPRYTAGLDNLEEQGRWGGENVFEVKDRTGESYVITPEPNWSETHIERTDLVAWLEATPIRPRIFFPAATDTPDYLNPKHPRYAHKLAAAVRAWQAATDLNGKHPKDAMKKWIRERAAQFGLTDDEGKPNETGIDESAKVANWQPTGGAPKTPGA